MVFEDFDINKVRSVDRMSKILSVRITRRDFEWIKKNRISATKLFNYALHKIMPKGKDDDIFEKAVKEIEPKERKKERRTK